MMPPESSPEPIEVADLVRRDELPGQPADRAASLVSVFYEELPLFGSIREVSRDAVPEMLRSLLDHTGHMTVTMEAFLGCPVSLRVLRESRLRNGAGERYVREIILEDAGRRPVQYGIVRLDLSAVPDEARRRIEAGSAPLGRILIEAGTFRDVHDVRLIEVMTGPGLAERIPVDPNRPLYGRVATISLMPRDDRAGRSAGKTVSDRPGFPRTAIELLEIPLTS